MKILVADDSKTNLALIAESLKKLGHEVVLASNGDEALLLYRDEHPDLIILDVVMEGVNGFECAKRIREIYVEDWIPIIFLSGAVDDENVSQGINAGGDDYITKPYSEIILAAKIRAMERIAEMRGKLYATTKQLRVLSSTDALTGVYNRFQFNKLLEEKINTADEQYKKLALLFFDIDHFKTVNDHLGHHTGDLLLVEVASRIKSCVRGHDIIARLGGDEFAVLIEDVKNNETIDSVVKKMISVLSSPYRLMGNDIHTSCSIGIAIYPFKDTTRDTFIQNADIAMYHAKLLGRNNYQYFTEELYEKRKEQSYIEDELKFAIERNEFSLNYQPVFHLVRNELVGAEVLLTWHHPRLGNISPSVFIPIAEEMGLITSIGNWVLRTVCEQGSKWYSMGFEKCKLSVNISANQFLREGIIETLNDTFSHTGMPIEMLEFEITETAVISYSELTERAIRNIHDFGVSISLDDFGTGYSSLSHLRKLPIKNIKIDKSFICNVNKDKHDSMIVKSVINLGKNMGFGVIAEGIETKEQLEFLIKNGCVLGQGYYLSRPLSTQEMTLFLEHHSTAVHEKN
ncbi:MAG: EAL domain-containing protein [Gammaproteobacteria bacterium]|nr:EAL domain-containing protein [Gammaproteobacteria bacterium]